LISLCSFNSTEEANVKTYSKSEIKSLVDAGKKKTIRVYQSLYLEIRSQGNASWVYRFQLNNHRSQMVIGVYSDSNPDLMDHDKAFKQAIDYNAMVLNGDNPKLDKARKKYHDIETVNDLSDLYIEQKRKYIKTIDPLIRIYERDIKPYIGHLLLKKVHPFDIFELVQKIVNSGRPSVATQGLYLCKNIFKLGVKCQLITSNPAENYTAKEDAGGNPLPRDVVLLEEDIEILFRVLRQFPKKVPEPTYIGITLLLILGMRKMELFSARWIDVCLERKFFQIYADNTKSKKSLAIPIPDNIVHLFERLKVLAGSSEYLFPARKRSSRGYISNDTVNHTIADLFGKVTSKRKPSENVLGKAGLPDFYPHDFRRSLRTLLSTYGVSLEVAERILNHADSRIVRTYNRYEYRKERLEAHELIAKIILPLAYPISV